MLDRRTGFRAANGRLEIGLDQLVAEICDVAEAELAFWQPAAETATSDMTDAGKERVHQYLTYLWDGEVPFHGRSRDRFEPDEHAWSAVFVCFCVTKAFEALFGEVGDRGAFRKVVPLARSQAHWGYARAAFRQRQRGRRGADATGTYWAYDAGTPLRRGDIVVKDRRALKPGQSPLRFSDLGKAGWAATHGDIVTQTTSDTATLIGGNLGNSVKESRYPLTAEGKIDRTDHTSGASRTFTVLRLKPRVEVVASSGAQHSTVLFDVLKGVGDERPVVPYRTGCASGAEVVFPSGESLCVADVPASLVAEGAEHWDAFGARHGRAAPPLLEVGGKRDVRLSEHFSVSEFVKGANEQYARIDPLLVERLQSLRGSLGRPIRINSGYRSWRYNQDLYARLYRQKKVNDPTPSRSPHTRGIAADIWVAGMSGLDLAKACVEAFGCDMGLGVFMGQSGQVVHVDVRTRWSVWTYGTQYAQARVDLERYRSARPGCG